MTNSSAKRLNKNNVFDKAKSKKTSCWSLEVEALVRQNFIPVGVLVDEVALGYVILSVHGVS
jgi:hypothetical protein